MKTRLFSFLLGMVLGAAVGFWLAQFYWVVEYGRKYMLATRLLQERMLAEEGQRTLDVYLHAHNSVAIHALTEHLRNLERAKSLFSGDPSPTNIMATLCLVDVLRAQMLCHARLAKVAERTGDTSALALHTEAALELAASYRAYASDFASVTNRTALQQFVIRCDQEGRFW